MTGPDPEAWRDGLVHLGPDWVLDVDGVPVRSAARVVLVDDAGRVLLARGHDPHEPDRSWWYTIGGGIDAGETPRSAAVREVAEETGLVLDPADLTGPVATRTALFDFAAHTVRQHEEFFLARVPADRELSSAGWTEIELRFMDELRWWTPAEVASTREQLYPEALPTLLAVLVDWDGAVRRLPDGP